jgi:DNA-binding beta-propeller fold protein YncE
VRRPSDDGSEIARLDTATNRIAERVPVAPRPGGFTAGGGFLWIFHAQRPTVTRLDPRTGSATAFAVPGALRVVASTQAASRIRRIGR